MKETLGTFQILVLVGYALGMVAGQMLFKLAALRVPADAGTGARLAGLAQNGWFIAALLLYGVLSVMWVWVLTFTPLARAYPFVALAFAVTPLVAGLVFAEPLSLRLLVGIAVIAGGLVLVAG
ncbi:MAG: hypothetical protein HXX10_22630 [Rhodoplanes sp.]|uniref:hypothetical protein n=1 Tax=Rhodoplanes sp. TaxID=1968906 RepID=UPI00184D42BE|nr:hypothetical protein [Rhodoplanes sp.]NVO16830.1 hypothetical protein [Rhodoplanes sp.]